MYRTTVDAISGAKIFAGGKWLQCIGNKTFHVGERIWTDGRCAYGNNNISQQPLVITAPKADTQAIPIYLSAMVIGDDYSIKSIPRYYTYRTMLKEVISNNPRSNDAVNLFFYNMINDRKGNAYYTRCARRTRGAYFKPLGIIAANVDTNNNFYTIHMRDGDYQRVDIRKNGNTISSFEPDIYVDRVRDRVSNRCTYLRGEKIIDYTEAMGVDCWIYKGFIENENNWALIMAINVYARNMIYEKVGETRSIFGGRLNVYRYNYHYTAEHSTFLVTQDGVTRIHHIEQDRKWFSAVEWDDADTGSHHLIEPEEINEESISVDTPEIQIPLQDGYYYTINEIAVPERRLLSGWVSAHFPASLSLFTPSGNKIMDGDFLLGTDLTICKVGNEKYLIGVGSVMDYFGEEIKTVFPYKGYIEFGLYLCEQGGLTLISSSPVRNHRLRHMGKINDWQNRIRELPTRQNL